MNIRLRKIALAMLMAACATPAALAADAAKLVPITLPYEGWVSQMSDNGRWGVCQAPTNSVPDAVAYRIDIATGKIEALPLNDEQADPKWGNICRCNDITDDGQTIVGEFNRYPAYFTGDSWHELPLLKGMSNWTGEVNAVTPDGKIMIGTMYKGAQQFQSMIWVDGKLEELGKLPDYDEMHSLGIINDSDLAEHKAKGDTPNIKFWQISSDGRYVLASADHNYPAWGASRFVYDRQTKTYNWIHNDTMHGETFVDESYMNNNGTVVAGGVHTYLNGDDAMIPFRYYPATKKLETEGQSACYIIDNAGQAYNASGSAPFFNLYIPVDGLNVPLDKILLQKYGIDFYSHSGCTQTGYPVAVSDDGRTLLCQGEFRTNAYAVTLPETFAEAARGVNLLTELAPNPPANSEIARLTNILVQLSYGADYDSTKVPVIKNKATGEVVATSIGVQATSSTKQIYRILFDNVSFEEGKTYTVVVPEGAFFIANTSFKTPELTVDYKGRKEAPLAATAISPASGSNVRELGSKNQIKVTFPTKVSVNTSAVSYLYVKGNAAPLSVMALSAEGNVLSIYPPASRMLNDGTDYVIKVAANAVTDITGFCGNEPFEIEYHGSYVPDPADADASYLFFDDFSSPAESLGKFLLYEGDHNKPTDDMAAVGFDADNTPWNFSIRDEDNYDYCAASHSMYNPAGQSEDWMVIPQLNILNKDCYLTFKGQNYRKNKADKIKVIVLEENDRLGSLDKNFIDRMKKDGKVVFETRLLPGNEEETVTDDWRSYEVKLDEFEGKKVYIAFLNENNNQSIVFIDDVMVAYRSDFTIGTVMPSVVVNAETAKISAFVRSNYADTFNNIEATYTTSDGTTGTFKADNINLKRNGVYEFEFEKPAPLTIGAENAIEIAVKLDDQLQNFSTVIKDYTATFDQRVLIEEGTGLWCGNCPQGAIAIDYLEKQFPGIVIPVAIHNDDAYATTRMDIYNQFLSINGFPTGRVNRRTELAAPMFGTSFISEAGNETFTDLVIQEIENPAEVRIKAKDATWFDDLEGILVPFEVEFAINKKNINYNVFAVLLEDGLEGRQHNYFCEYTEDVYGIWGKYGEYGIEAQNDRDQYCTVINNHVARCWAGTSLYGVNGLIPQNVEANRKYEGHVILDWLGETEDLSKCSVALAIIDAGTGRVINSDIFTGGVPEKEESGVEGITAENVKTNFTVNGGRIFANGSADNVEIYSLQGMRVANNSLHGVYIVKANGKTSKILVK